MKFRNLAAVAAIATMTAAPVVAADRSAAPIEDESELAGGAGIIVAILAAAAIIGAIYIAVDNGDDDAVSP